MAIKDILVHVDASEGRNASMEAAIRLAQAHDAHLTGLYVLYPPFFPMYGPEQIPTEFFEKQLEADRQRAGEAETHFNQAADHAGIAHEWRCVEGPVSEAIADHAHSCDLVVLAQRDPDSQRNDDMPDGAILTVGRPVLIIPYAGHADRIGKRVMVAWDASAQAARAVHDALPLLADAEEVDVVAINANGSNRAGEIPCADISRHLARHGVPAEAQSLTVRDVGIADMLLSRAADRGIDLFVMGAYGHSRWRELVLGGVTAHMLEHMTMPVLMTH